MLKKVQRRDKHMKPRIFVSSTFYDLKYMRDDLSNYIKAHDFEPIMFEDGDIGYTPGKHLDESCYETMKSADMVILIIGGNYGSPASGENKDDFEEYLSITRKEFKTAIDEAIPIFAFIDASVYAEYGIYEENVNAIESQNCKIKFRATKDINVFRFIRDIKAVGNISITEFKKSGEIKNFLGKQWSDMFKAYLKSLREDANTIQVHDAIERLNTMMQQMEVMVNGLGKKIFNNQGPEFDQLVLQQRRIKAREIARRMSRYITCTFQDERTRKDNVVALVNCYRNYLQNVKDDKIDMTTPEGTKLFQDFIGNLVANGISLQLVNGSLLECDELLREFCESYELKEEVIRNLTKNSYYNLLHRRTDEEIIQEKTNK